jgi:hypothetical protein
MKAIRLFRLIEGKLRHASMGEHKIGELTVKKVVLSPTSVCSTDDRVLLVLQSRTEARQLHPFLTQRTQHFAARLKHC